MKLLNLTIVFCLTLILSSAATGQEVGGIKGKVRSLQGGELPGVSVTARQNDKDIKSTSTDKKGNFQIEGLKAGKYTFVFNKSGYVSGSITNVEIGKNKIRDFGDRLALDLDEGSLVIVEGSVFNRDGYSVYGAIVDIGRVSSDGTIKKLKSSYSSISGGFRFRFPDGTATYRVTASAKGKKVSKDITVDSAAIYRLALTLDLARDEEN